MRSLKHDFELELVSIVKEKQEKNDNCLIARIAYNLRLGFFVGRS